MYIHIVVLEQLSSAHDGWLLHNTLGYILACVSCATWLFVCSSVVVHTSHPVDMPHPEPWEGVKTVHHCPIIIEKNAAESHDTGFRLN